MSVDGKRGCWTLIVLSVVLGGIGAYLLTPKRNHIDGASSMIFSNVRQILFAIHDYEERHKHLPGNAIRDEAGKPLLSWRVAILPYIEQEVLYERFKLDEPWDSRHNIALLKEMPQIYAMPNQAETTETYMQVLVGPGTAFERTDKPLTLQKDFPDGRSNTILLVVADRPVPWTKPEDMAFHPEGVFPVTGEGWKRGGFSGPRIVIGFADGSIMGNAENYDPLKLRHLAVRNDGMP